MNQTFTFKSVLLALLVMICCAAKAETVSYTDNDFDYYINLETQEASLNKYNGNAANVVIPEYVTYEGKAYKVTSLSSCFYGCSSVVSVVIPSSVTSLGTACFMHCSSLVSVDIPSSVTSIGDMCFNRCSSLTSIRIPSSVKSLGESCLYGCSSLEAIVVDVHNPRYDSREGCNAIIETASNTMIRGCKNTLIPSSVTSLGRECFSNCYSLISIDIPSSVTSLGEDCFYDCSSLVSVVIPSSVTTLGRECFFGCPSLVSIDIPSSVTSIGEYCFYDCSSLVSVVIPSSVTSIGDYCFCDCSSLVSIDIPSSVMSLGEESFAGCSSLASVDIPSSVTNLGEGCFSGCFSLASVDIPSSVTNIGGFCFSNCPSLKTVICRMENVESGYFFYWTPIGNATLYVPKSLLTIYQTTEPWSSFGTILPLTEEELGIGNVSKPAVTLRSDNGSVILSGLADGTPVSYYSVDGCLLGRTSVDHGSASFSVKPNRIVTVKAGKQSFKMRVK